MNQDQLANVKSPDSSCPNCQFGLYAEDDDAYVWNVDASTQDAREDDSILTMGHSFRDKIWLGRALAYRSLDWIQQHNHPSKFITMSWRYMCIHCDGEWGYLIYFSRWWNTMKIASIPIIHSKPWISISSCGLLWIQRHVYVVVGYTIYWIGLSTELADKDLI